MDPKRRGENAAEERKLQERKRSCKSPTSAKDQFCKDWIMRRKRSDATKMKKETKNPGAEKAEREMIRAAGNGNLHVVKRCTRVEGIDFDARNEEGNTALARATLKKQFNVVRYLVENTPVGLGVKNNKGERPLTWAAGRGYLSIAKYLVEHGDDLEERTNRGDTPLILAAYHNCDDVVEYLLEANADVEALGEDNMTALEW
eukprot:CAMPEP_0167782664 /NCGR_PEP_ID=MMETSP0111_2-20121227/6644_1 /TAXON_ID=91324 /ORGANISM="Lotharella globosa, Strain CCCM811" /LENGTH=201 /DNA_ID=CAMNT_0007673523 /DNA_START=1 /DNA_END=603 /DNA_ORIENTATION=+